MNLNEKLLQRIASNVQIFRGIPRQCSINVLAGAEKWEVAAGKLFFSEGDSGSAFFILVSGEAVVEKSQQEVKVVLANLSPGDCFGEMALLNPNSRSASVRAVKDCLALSISKQKMEAFPEAAAFIYRNMAKTLAIRLQKAGTMVSDLTLALTETESNQAASAEKNPTKNSGMY